MKQASTTRYYDNEPMRTGQCPGKQAVLSFMRSFEPVAAAAGYVYDEVAGSYADGITMQAMVTKGHRAIKHTMACSFMWCPRYDSNVRHPL